MSNFKFWTRDKLRKRFGLKRVYGYTLLADWLKNKLEIDDYERITLKRWRENMEKFIDFWNEEEVKLKFIGNLISLVNFDTESLSIFAERELSGVVDGEELNGFPDMMVARGKQEVDTPFFFLHEYKKELDNHSPDPAGQCLAAMLLAYEKNLEVPQMAEKPVYGAYVIGRNWFFVVLKDREYGISDAYVATHEDELMDILRILKSSRETIREIWGE
ncbi:MAG: hypothetical protein EAZ97_05125 [Bacteroidetes bacterium]|nr:MAG: hypothetical protein EAZ97_05125 [Bacteroidota bacterium]